MHNFCHLGCIYYMKGGFVLNFGTEQKYEKLRQDALIERAIREYADTVYRIAFQYTGNISDAQDILQEVSLTLVTADPPFEDEGYLRNWICRVTVNKCKNLRKYLRFHTFEELDESVPSEESETISLSEELKKLPKKYRTVLYLYYYEEFSIEEISEILSINKNTVGSQLRRARDKLRRIIEEGEKDRV